MPKSKREFKQLTVRLGPAFKGSIKAAFPPNPRWRRGPWVFHSYERYGSRVVLTYERSV